MENDFIYPALQQNHSFYSAQFQVF